MTDGGIEALCEGATGEEENKLQGGKQISQKKRISLFPSGMGKINKN